MERPSGGTSRGISVVVVVLAAVTLGSATLRYVVPHDLHVAILRPLLGAYALDQLAVLRQEPLSEAAHRIGGALYLLLGLLQLAPGVRRRWPALHRWGGRAFIALALIASVSGAVIAAIHPYVPGERLPSFLFAALLVGFTLEGLRRARLGDMERHRQWMIRGFATGLGVGMIRVIAVGLTLGTDLPTRSVVAPTFWAGWCTTLLATEVWLRTRGRASRPSAAASTAAPRLVVPSGPSEPLRE